jgi:ATP-dependent RNA helicase DDX27
VQIKHIVSLAPRKRQTLLFSATISEKVQQLITLSLQSPVRLAADRPVAVPSTLQQEILRLKGSAAADKVAVLLALCKRSLCKRRVIVFCAQKWQAHRLKILMGLAGLPHASELHGDLTQVNAS